MYNEFVYGTCGNAKELILKLCHMMPSNFVYPKELSESITVCVDDLEKIQKTIISTPEN